MMRRKLFIMIAGLFTLCAGLFAKGDTYIYDFWDNIEKSPDVYRVTHVVYADDFNHIINSRIIGKNDVSLIHFSDLSGSLPPSPLHPSPLSCSLQSSA